MENNFGSGHHPCLITNGGSTNYMCMQPLVEYISIHCHDNGAVGNFDTVKQLLIQQCEGRSNKWRLCSVAVLDFGE